jgi:hypothetical protein
MTPTVFEGPEALDLLPGFDDIFCEFEVIADTNAGGGAEQALELVACLLFRSTMMLDHLEIEAGANRWRYTPPVEVLEIVERTVPRMPLSELPLRTYLHLLDAIAWNEDVKYSRAATTKSQVPRDTGRPNMLATCVTFILMTLGRLSPAETFAQMAKRRGVCTMSQKDACELLPPLVPSSLRLL